MSEPTTVVQPGAPQPSRGSRSAAPAFWGYATLLVIAIGIALRIWILRSPAGRLDSDEAVVALMGDSIRTGHKPTLFFSGQYYGGVYEPMLTAIALALHRSVLAVKMVPLLCSAIAAVITARIARRFVTPQRARLAGALLFAWPGTTWLSTKERGFYWVMLLCVLAALLCAVRLHHREPRRNLAWIGFGLAAGSGWYTSAQSIYVIVPLTAWLVFATRPKPNEACRAAGGFLLGAAPWIYGLLKFGDKVFHQEPPAASYPTRLNHVVVQLIPRVLGTRHLFVNGWTLGPLGVVATVIGVVSIGAVCGEGIFAATTRRTRSTSTETDTDRMTREHTRSATRLLCALAVAFPFLAAIPSLATFVSEPRYGLLLIPSVVLLLVLAMTTRMRASLLVIVVMTFAVASTTDLIRLAKRPSQALLDLAPPDTTALEAMLHGANVSRVYADYWLAYPLTFRHPNGLVASPLDLPRVAGAQRVVDDARSTTWIVYVDSSRDRALDIELSRRGVSSTRRAAGPFAVYQLDRYLNPLDLNRFWVIHPPGR